MKLSFAVTLFLIGGCAWAQTIPNPFYGYQPLAQVKQFLQLSDTQVQTILTNNDEYNRWASEKQSRIAQVQSEIAEETAKEALDPNALGIRYAEVESICRDMKDKASDYRKRNLAVLTQEQKTKLNALEEAMKLASVISQAQEGNLIGGLTYPTPFFTSTSASSSTSGTLIGGFIGPVYGCSLPFPTALVRSGDFSSAASAGPGERHWKDSAAEESRVKHWFDTTRIRSDGSGHSQQGWAGPKFIFGIRDVGE